MSRRPKREISITRIIWICCLTVFFTSVATITIFYLYFGDELISDGVGRVVERTVGYRVSLTGIRLAWPGRVAVDGMSLVAGPVAFSSGPAILEFRLGLTSPLTIKKVTMDSPSISVDMSRGGGGDGEKIIRKIMALDVAVTDGMLVLAERDGRYVFRDVNMTYEHGLFGASLTIAGSGRTEGIGEGAMPDGPFHASMRIMGTYPDVSVRGTVDAETSGYRIGDFLFMGESISARVRIDQDGMEATDITVDGLSIDEREHGLLVEGITASGEVKKVNGGPFTLGDVRLSVPRFGDIALNLTVEEDGEWNVTTEADSLTLSSANLRRLGDYAPDFMTGLGITGRARSVLSMGTVDAVDRSVVGNLEVDLINAGFSTPDSLYLGQGITGSGRLTFRDDIRGGFSFDGAFSVHDFGLLLSGLFVNFDKRQISVTGSGIINDGKVLKEFSGEVAVPSVFTAAVSGDVDFGGTDTRGRLSYKLKVRDMGGAFDILFRNYFMNRVDWLFTGAVSGSLDCRGTIEGNLARPRISGRLAVNGASLGFSDIDTTIEGISADVPFSVDLAGGSKKGEAVKLTPADFGRITVSRAVFGGVDIGAIELLPGLKENTFALKDDVELRVSGGTVIIGGVRAEDIFGEDGTTRLSLVVKGVDIAGLFPKEKLINLKGELSGDLTEAKLEGKKLFTSGGLTAKIFNGNVRIDTIWGQDIFDAGRRLGCDVAFEDIDLGALTETIDVGKVTGIARGRISDLIFSYGGPERFVFDVETVDRRGVEKRVSVDFVDKLTILGSGSTLFSGVLRSGLNRFVHDYNYSEIGIHLELKNDYFTLRGKIHEGDTEYFIKRSGFTGINVINQNPNNLIRFNDMMQRLERINIKDSGDIRIEKQ